jgi:hypothetical protein
MTPVFPEGDDATEGERKERRAFNHFKKKIHPVEPSERPEV